MIDVYLFDWGDTLMVDFPGVSGKMCDWDVVEAVDGAREALEHLSQQAKIYIATGASQSTESDIIKAFHRVELEQYISGYFCKANIGLEKGTPDFLMKIIRELGVPPSRIAMVGDNLSKDIEPAMCVGIQPIWLTKAPREGVSEDIRMITELRELCIAILNHLLPVRLSRACGKFQQNWSN